MSADLESISEATSGAIGALVSTTILYPLDTCKAKYQAEVQAHGLRKYRFLVFSDHGISFWLFCINGKLFDSWILLLFCGKKHEFYMKGWDWIKQEFLIAKVWIFKRDLCIRSTEIHVTFKNKSEFLSFEKLPLLNLDIHLY